MTMMRLPPPIVRRIGALPKSKSGPTLFGQFALSGRQPITNASAEVAWFHHRIFPVLRSMAMTESLVGAAGSVYELPVPMNSSPRPGSMVGDDQTAAPAVFHNCVPAAFRPASCGGSGMVYVFQSWAPVAASSATTLPRKVQH